MNTETLKKALQKAKPFVAPRSTLPVLGNVALYTDNGRLWVEATDLELACRIPVAHDGEFAGITVAHKVLSKIANALDCAELDFGDEDDCLVITGTGTKARLPGIDRDEFPPIARKSDRTLAVMGAGVLKRIATLIAPSASTDEARPTLMHVCAELTKEGVLFVATDGFMLSKLQVDAKSGDYAAIDDETTLLVPARAWKAVAGLASSANEDVTLGVILDKEGEPWMVMFTFASGAQAVVMLCQGTFPTWQDIWPKAFTGQAVVTGLGQAVKPLLAFADRDYLKSDWTFDEEGLVISVKSEGASMTRSVEAVTTGEPLTTHFDLILVNSLLKRGKFGGLALRYSAEFGPTIFDMGDWATAAMPMRDR